MQRQDNPGLHQSQHHLELGTSQPLRLPSIVAGESAEQYGSSKPTVGDDGRLMAFFAHNADSVSPIEQQPIMNEFRRASPVPAPPFLGHLAASTMHSPKRIYRQRRKDPSCDACRERKVKVSSCKLPAIECTDCAKCDATDTVSCSECSSRNVRCQFTKDTNRRMSSIKYVTLKQQKIIAKVSEASSRSRETTSRGPSTT